MKKNKYVQNDFDQQLEVDQKHFENNYFFSLFS